MDAGVFHASVRPPPEVERMWDEAPNRQARRALQRRWVKACKRGDYAIKTHDVRVIDGVKYVTQRWAHVPGRPRL